MNRLAKWIMRLYPARWRKRYGDELDALLADTGADARVAADLLRGGIRMQFSTWSFPRLAAVLGVAGILVGLAVAFLTPTQYAASAELRLTGADSDVETAQMLRTKITSRQVLSSVINNPRIGLYQDQLRNLPMQDLIDQMRDSLVIDEHTPDLTIRFTYPDRVKAQRVTAALAAAAIQAMRELTEGSRRTDVALNLQVTDTASLPTSPLPWNRWLWMSGGLLTGLLLAFFWRVFSGLRATTAVTLVIACAAAGIALTWIIPRIAPAFPEGFFPLRYQSYATMYTEMGDAVSLGDIVTELSTRTALAGLITNPRLQLYQSQLTSHTLDEVAEKMRHDVVIATRDAGRGARWIDISFIYPDRQKSHDTVAAIMERLDEQNLRALRGNIPPARLRNWGNFAGLTEGRAPDVTTEAITPDRAVPLVSGLITGLLAAGLIALLRRRWTASEPEEVAPPPARHLTFHRTLFQRLALLLTLVGAASGMIVALRSPARYVSNAQLSLENAKPEDAAKMIGDAVDRARAPGVTWNRVNGAFRLQLASHDPNAAQSGLQNVLGDLDRSLLGLHGHDETQFESIRGVDGALLPIDGPGDFNTSDNSPSRLATMRPQIVARTVSPAVDAIPFDDDRAIPAARPEYRAVRMNVMDAPDLPTAQEGVGWQAVAVGAAAGLALATVITLLAGFGNNRSLARPNQPDTTA